MEKDIMTMLELLHKGQVQTMEILKKIIQEMEPPGLEIDKNGNIVFLN